MQAECSAIREVVDRDPAAAALRMALKEARLGVGGLAYLIGRTTGPARLAPPNIALVADRLGFSGPYMELRQGCTGFANALVIAQGLTAVPGVKDVGNVGSETSYALQTNATLCASF
jgi:3-oxoacyl-[acyl-carrier-protein] synthase-3